MITRLLNSRTSAIPCSRTSAIRRLKTCIPWLWIVTIAPKHTRSGYARWQFLDAKITRAQMISCSHEMPGKNFSTAHPSRPDIRTKSFLHRIDRGARWSMNKSSPGRTRKSSPARMFAIILCGVVRHRLSSAVHRERCSNYRTASETPMETLHAITWERYITWMPAEVSTRVYGLLCTHWWFFGLFLGFMFSSLHMLFLTWIYDCFFSFFFFIGISADQMQIDLRYPSWLNTTNSVCIFEVAFSFPAFLCFFCIQTNADHGFRQPCSANMLPLCLDLLSSPTQSLMLGHFNQHTRTHIQRHVSAGSLGLLLYIVCPPVCMSRLHTYSISLFGYLLAMKRIDISRIRSNSIPLLGLGINITAIPVSLESLLRQRQYIYLSFFFYYIYLYIIHISLPAPTMVPNLLAQQTCVRSTHHTVIGSHVRVCIC